MFDKSTVVLSNEQAFLFITVSNGSELPANLLYGIGDDEDEDSDRFDRAEDSSLDELGFTECNSGVVRSDTVALFTYIDSGGAE